MGFRIYRMSKLYAFLFVLLFLSIFYLHSMFEKRETVNTKVLLATGIDLLEEAGKRVVEIRRSPYMSVHHKEVGKEKIVSELLTNADIASHKVIKYGLASVFPGLKVTSEEHSDMGESLVYLPNTDRIKLPALNGGEEVPLTDISVWIDPLDATQEYSENLTEYVTIMMCVVRKNDPILGIVLKPFQKKLYWAYRSQDASFTSWKQRDFSTETLARKPRIIVSRSHAGDVKDLIREKFNSKFDVLPAGGSGFKAIEVMEGRAEAYLHTTHIKKWDVCAPNALFRIAGLGMTDLRGLPLEYSNPDDFLNVHGLLATRGDVTPEYDHLRFLKALMAKKR